MITAVDTNILLDILIGDPDFYDKSFSLIEEYGAKGALIICPLVYTELLVFFIKRSKDEATTKLDEFLSNLSITVIGFSKEDTLTAATAWHNKTSIDKIQCSSCGHEQHFVCMNCRKPVKWRTHFLTDFFIGAHAQNRAAVLLTRDQGFYKKHFTIKIEN